MNKLRLYRIYDIECDGKLVVSAKKKLVADLKFEADATKYAKEMETLYIVEFDQDDNPVKLRGVVFGECDNYVGEDGYMLNEPKGKIKPWIDLAEHDFRVYATVAFGVDLM